MNNLDQETLKKHLRYDPETGEFYWLIPRSCMDIGDRAGTDRRHDGKTYRIITLFNKKYRAHRLAWLWMIGSFPEQQIDHINGNGSDNRWCNLREVSPVENNRNMRQRVDNKSGVTGVHWSKKDRRWVVSIKTEKNSRGHIGQYGSLLDAVCARFNAEMKHKFHENHGTRRPL